jgi:hypothetical protein
MDEIIVMIGAWPTWVLTIILVVCIVAVLALLVQLGDAKFAESQKKYKLPSHLSALRIDVKSNVIDFNTARTAREVCAHTLHTSSPRGGFDGAA